MQGWPAGHLLASSGGQAGYGHGHGHGMVQQQGYYTPGGMLQQSMMQQEHSMHHPHQQHHQHQQQQMQQGLMQQPHTPRHAQSPPASSKQPLEELLRQPLGSASSAGGSGQGEMGHPGYLDHDERLLQHTGLSARHDLGAYALHPSHQSLQGLDPGAHHMAAMQGHAMGHHALQASMARQLHAEQGLQAAMYDLQRTG